MKHRFGEDGVFLDVERLQGGDDFREELKKAITQADVFIVVISSAWVSATNIGRLHNESDIVRREIELALARRSSGLVILPVLFDDTQLPRADDLPVSISSLLDMHVEMLDQRAAFSSRLDDILTLVDRHCGGLLARKANTWLLEGLADPVLAKTRFGQNIAVLAPGQRPIHRNAAHSALDGWWQAWPEDARPLILLGEEGDGKSWALADWLAKLAQRADTQIPLLYVYAKRAEGTDLRALLELGLNAPLPGFSLQHWLDSAPPITPQPDFLLVVDAFNENPGRDWFNLIEQAGVAPWKGRVAIIALCRPAYWNRHLANRAAESVITWALNRFDERELVQALAERGRRSAEFRDEVLAIMAKPRYFGMALRLHLRLAEGEVTVERLIYESWREMYEAKWHENRPFGHDEFLRLIRDLARPYLEGRRTHTRDLPSLIPPGPWQSDDILQDILSARIVTEDEDSIEISKDYLALGLGLLMAVEVEKLGDAEAARLDEVIAKRISDANDMDIHSRICGMALYHAMVKRDYPEAGRLALFRAWLDSRNIEQADLDVVVAYLPLRPETYLKMAVFLWGATNDRAAQDAFMAGFLRHASLPVVQKKLVKAFTEWLGLVHSEGYRHRLLGIQEPERDEIRKEVEDRLGTTAEPGKLVDRHGYRLTVVDNDGAMRLRRVATAIISHPHIDRQPYTPALATGLVAGTVMGYCDDTINWICRVAEPAIQNTLLDQARVLSELHEPIADRAARRILQALNTEEALALHANIPAETSPQRPFEAMIAENPCGTRLHIWNQATYQDCLGNNSLPRGFVATQMRELALNPDLVVPADMERILDGAADDLDFNHVYSDKGFSLAQGLVDDMEPALCAFAPEQYAKLARNLARQLPTRQGRGLHNLARTLSPHVPALDIQARYLIEEAWRDTLPNSDDESRRAEHDLFPQVLFDQTPEVQFELVIQRRNGTYLTRYEPHFRPVTRSMLPDVKSALSAASEEIEERKHKLLWYLSHVLIELDNDLRALLLDLYHDGDTITRALCMESFIAAKDREAAEAVIQDGWQAQGTTTTRYEDIAGSRLLCHYGSMLPFDEVAARLDPPWWGRAVFLRGMQSEELADYARLLDNNWRRITHLLDPTQDEDYVSGLGIDRANSDSVGLLTVRPRDSGNLSFTDNTWGGSAGTPSIEQLHAATDHEVLAKAHTAANKRAVQRIDAMRAAGNPWYMDSFQSGLLDKVVATPGTRWCAWIAPILSGSDDGRRLLALCQGFYEKLCAALLEHKPATGAALFRAMRPRQSRIEDLSSHLPILHLDLFAATDTPDISALRRVVLDECAFDRDLFEIALMAELGGQSAWLDRTIDEGLASERMFEQARALALLGLSSRHESGDRLARFLADHSDSWPRRVAESASRNHQRDTWARRWFQRFLDEQERIQAWAAFRLFLRCVDRRYLIWLPEAGLDVAAEWKQEAFAANRAALDKAAKDNEKEWSEGLLGQKELRDQVWPWMGRYLM
jgi:hypothetical protein